jgi:hypothetical protein
MISLEAFLNLFTFLYPGLLCSFLLFWMVYGVGVCPAAGFPGRVLRRVLVFTMSFDI